jgi:dihydrofolate reductase
VSQRLLAKNDASQACRIGGDRRVERLVLFAPKVVFSRSLKNAAWSNTRLVGDAMLDTVRALKRDTPQDLVVLGSGSIVSQLAQENLVDEYQTVVVPIVLGSGRTLFEGLDHRQPLRLTQSRTFSNGNVVLWHKRSPT